MESCNSTTSGADTGEGQGKGGGEAADRTRGNGIDRKECGDAARARGASLGDHCGEGANVEHNHCTIFVANW